MNILEHDLCWPGGNYTDCQRHLVTRFKCRNCLEIGLNVGNSTNGILTGLAEIGGGSLVSIDNDAEGYCGQGRSIAESLIAENVTWQWLAKSSQEAFSELQGMRFDYLYIDGDHAELAVEWDWEHYSPMTTLVLFDDYQLPGPRIVVDRIIQQEAHDVCIIDPDGCPNLQALVRRK